MAKFLEGDELNSTLVKLIRDADNYLILISPYIKLHSRIRDALKQKRQNNELEITVVFGKSEQHQNNRISEDDLNFLKDFPNIEIRYEKNLHAKYYASEDGAIITSLNLYDFSQNHNIEAGILLETPKSLIDNLTTLGTDRSIERESFAYFKKVIENADPLFKRKTEVKQSFLGLRKEFQEPVVDIDILTTFFSKVDTRTSFSGYKAYDQKVSVKPVAPEEPSHGYCIRTGRQIPFNIEKPFSADAYRSWSQFGNQEYPENYCHYTGEKSDGATCYSTPILFKNWRKAKTEHNL